jgi:hypothetical protein
MSKVEDKTVDTKGTVTGSGNSLQKVKKSKKNFSKLTNMRIIQKQLVYVIGLSQDFAFKDVRIRLNPRILTILNSSVSTVRLSN